MKNLYSATYKFSVKDVAALIGLNVVTIQSAFVTPVNRAPIPGEVQVPEAELTVTVTIEKEMPPIEKKA